MLNWLKRFEHGVVLTLIVMMALVVALSVLELAMTLYKDVFTPPLLVLDAHELLEIFGYFLMILIGLELLETMKEYLICGRIRLHVIFAVALIALSRKVITIEPEKYAPLTLMGMALLILALVAGYWIVRRHDRAALSDADECSPPP